MKELKPYVHQMSDLKGRGVALKRTRKNFDDGVFIVCGFMGDFMEVKRPDYLPQYIGRYFIKLDTIAEMELVE